MIAVPFLYFSLLSIWIYKKNHGRIDIALFITLLYALSGLFSILVETFKLGYYRYEVTILPTIVYCFLLTINIYPFLKYSHINIRNVSALKSDKYLKITAWLAIIWFSITLLFSFNSMIRILSGDMAEFRSAIYAGDKETGWMVSLPGPVRSMVALLNLCFGCPWILILLAFYSYYIQRMPLKFFLFFLIASLSGPVSGVLGADRSATAYWILSLLAIYIFFFPLIPTKQKKYLNSFLLIIVSALAIYLSAMTVSRFGEREMGQGVSGTQGSLISYFGQSFPNFCYFFDEFKPAFTNLNLIFPNIAKYIFNSDLVGGVPLQQEMTLRTRIETGVFYTYLGHIRIFCGMFFMFLYSILYTFISRHFLQKSHSFSLKNSFTYIGLSSIMYLGLFVYFYASPNKSFSVMFFLIFIHLISKSNTKQIK